MARFIKKVLLILVPVFILSFCLDYFFSGILRKSNNHADGELPVWDDLYNGNINSKIVIYGSSRAWVHINSEMIYDSLGFPAYNLGINGHSFLLQYLRHSILLKNNTKPKLIIQTLDVTTLKKGTDLYNPDQFLPFMLNNTEMKQSTLSYNGYSSLDYEIPLLRYYGKKEAFIEILRLLVKPSTNTVKRIRGYQGQDETWNDDFNNAVEQLGSFSVKVDPSLKQLFERYLTECKSNNIKVIFVYTPEYIDGQKFVQNRSEILSYYGQTSKKYGIPFFDYSRDSISFHKEYFYNSEHLTRKGAEMFTNMLIRDIKESGVLNEPMPR